MPLDDTVQAQIRAVSIPRENAWDSDYSRKTLLFILLLAFALRLGWMLYDSRAIENEGAEYARIAQNLLQGNGYKGILGGREAILPPLYPFLIAATSFVSRDMEIAGRLISIVSGSLLVLPVFFISERLFGSRAAFLAATLIALHPVLVVLSASVYVEATYLTLLFAGLYFGIRVLDFDHPREAVFAGLLLGLAYLARPEALGYSVLIGLFVLCALFPRSVSIATAFKYCAILAITTIVLVIPYATYLTKQSGTFRLEGKSGLNGIINRRMNRGMSYQEAAYGLGSNLEAEGPYLTADQFSIKAPSTSSEIGATVHSYFHGIAGRFAYIVIAVGAERGFGSPLICLLVLVGLFRPKWCERKWLQEGLLLSAAGLTVIILLSLRFVWGRYLYPFLPFLVLWAAAGIIACADWVSRWVEDRNASALRIATVVALAGVLLGLAWAGLRRDGDLAESRKSYLRAAGLWLNHYKAGRKDLMAIGSTLPYYANATELYLPYADSSRALAYIHLRRPDFIVLQADELEARPYLREWFVHGVPDVCAKPIQHTEGPILQQIEIYEWTCSN